MGLRERLKSDKRAAGRKIHNAKRELKRRAGRDVAAAERAVAQKRAKLDTKSGREALKRRAKARARALAMERKREIRGESDDVKQMFARAEDAAMAGPPVDASLEPLSAPEQMDAFVMGGSGGAPRVDELAMMGGGPRDGPGVDELAMMGSSEEGGGVDELAMLGGSSDEEEEPLFEWGGGY